MMTVMANTKKMTAGGVTAAPQSHFYAGTEMFLEKIWQQKRKRKARFHHVVVHPLLLKSPPLLPYQIHPPRAQIQIQWLKWS